MKRNTKIIQISGIRGLLVAIFVVTCLAAGFIVFPSIVSMYAWNFVAEYLPIPAIGVVQGLMLWAIIAISGFIINDRKKYLVAFKAPSELSEEEMKKILDRVKMQAQARALNSMLLKSTEIKAPQDKEVVKEDSEKEKENV